MSVTDSIIKVAGYCVAFISQQKFCSFDIFLLFKRYFFLGILEVVNRLEWWSFSHWFDFVVYLFLETISLILFCLSGLELSVQRNLPPSTSVLKVYTTILALHCYNFYSCQISKDHVWRAIFFFWLNKYLLVSVSFLQSLLI